MRLLDLHDWEVGCLCGLCGDQGKHIEADLKDVHIGPVCSECMIDLLRAERVLRDSFAPAGGRNS
ncbi:MAG: hypothetical protein ACOYNN_04065 [Terrimicrobiaceae bacterium]